MLILVCILYKHIEKKLIKKNTKIITYILVLFRNCLLIFIFKTNERMETASWIVDQNANQHRKKLRF